MVPNLLLYSLLASSVLAVARMALPGDFQASAYFAGFDGFGGRNAGHYRFVDPDGAGYDGTFRRDESRSGIFDPLYVRNKGKSAFSFADDKTGLRLDAECSFRKVTLNIDVVTFDTKKLAYACDFRGSDGDAVALFALGEARREGLKQKFLARDLRRGDARIAGRALTIESVHDYRGSKLSSQAPVGYLLREGDRVVAALELTDVDPGLYLADGLERQTRIAAIVSSLALAVFRDPAVSALEDP